MRIKFMTSRAAKKPCAENDLRCLCGSLIARLVEGGVEVKCRRCQRLVLLPLEPGAAAAAAPSPGRKGPRP
jgi:hypothetical protein